MLAVEERGINDIRIWMFFMEAERGVLPEQVLLEYSDFIESKGGFYHA